MKYSVKFAAASLVLALAGFAQAQSWPTKPMIFLNPFPAGGGTDTFARPIAARLGQTLGEQALIENQGGAGGTGGVLPSRGNAEQSPRAKMSGSRVVCKVGRTTSWLIRLVSSPSRSLRRSAPLIPAAQTARSAG